MTTGNETLPYPEPTDFSGWVSWLRANNPDAPPEDAIGFELFEAIALIEKNKGLRIIHIGVLKEFANRLKALGSESIGVEPWPGYYHHLTELRRLGREDKAALNFITLNRSHLHNARFTERNEARQERIGARLKSGCKA